MTPFRSTLFAIILLLLPCVGQAQIINFCPTNIDFEQGNFFNWTCFTGTCCPINCPTNSGPLAGRHEITSGGTDQYGNFPVVAPGGGQYSLKLGNNNTGAQAERVRYYVNVPVGLNNYSLVYRYAVVFENPGHSAPDQPRFEVKGFDVATMSPIPCATFTYVSAGSGNNGFTQSTVNTGVWYKSWTTASLNLSGYGGQQLLLEFSSGDCALSGHFGYGYVDMNCGLFSVSGNACGLSTTVLSAPYGFDTYTWWNANYTSQIGTGQVITISTPPVTTTYHVIIAPQPGFGCPDTLTTTVNVTNMTFGPNSNDTTVCPGANVPLHIQAQGNTGPFTYSWFPTTGLSCTSCQNPIATNVQNTITYYASATDTNGCIKLDTITINVNNFSSVTMNVNNINCNGGTGSITAVPVGGSGPYTYQWLPVGTGGNVSTVNNLAPGTYTVNVTDSMGCLRTATATISAPAALNLQMAGTSVNCFGQTTGQASVVVTGGTPGYTYSWAPTGGTNSTANNLTGGTYTVTVTDANGCTAQGTATVASPPQLTATINPNTVVHVNCFGQNTGCATVTVAGGTQPYTYFWSSNPAQYTAQACNLFAGNYTCQVTDANGCTVTAAVTITQPTQLVASIVSSTNTTCSGSNGSATGGASGGTPPYTYSWNNNTYTGATISGLAPGLYTLTVTDNKGCTATTTVQISTSSSMAVVMSKTDATCNGAANGTASVVATGGTQPYTYSWAPSGGLNATTTPVTAGNYIVTVTDAMGCVMFGNVTIGEPTAVLATITNQVNVNCNGLATGTATVGGSGGTGPYTYLWSNGQTTTTATNLSAGTYTITVTDTKGCIDTAHVNITQPAPVTVQILTQANATCSQTNGTISVVGQGGTQPYTYNWSNNQTTSTITNLGPGTYTVTVKDVNNCVGTATITIQQSTALSLNTATSDVSCFGLTDGWASAQPQTGVPPYNYMWSNGDTDSLAQGLAAGTYTIDIQDATGCPGTANVIITEPTSPLAAAITNVADVKCFGANDGTALAAGSGGTAPYTYLWNTGSTNANPNNMAPGNYTVVVTDDHGCTDSANTQITEPAELFLTAQATASSCEGANMGTADAVATGGTTPYSIAWATTPPQNGTSATGMNPGTYNVTVTDGNGCQKTTAVTIIGLPSPTVDAGPDQVFCFGLNGVQLNASGADTYQWTPAAGLSCTNCPNPVASPNNTSTYVVTGTDPSGCSGTDQVVVTVYTDQPTSTGSSKDICVGDIAQLNASGGQSYIWTPADNLTDPTIANPVATPTATTEYQVVIIENPCFSDTLTQLINVYARPTVSLGPDRKELSGSTIIIKADTTSAYSITWTPPTNLSCDDCIDPTVNVERTASYVVTVANPGCTATDDININVSCEKTDLFIANTFTPNNDGNNDAFYPQTPGLNNIRTMMIFNRWGEKVYQQDNFPANNPKYGWDGSFKGKPLSPDTYVYLVEYICGDGTKIQLKGDISLVR
jgi:gliding motility-associated-like protein